MITTIDTITKLTPEPNSNSNSTYTNDKPPLHPSTSDPTSLVTIPLNYPFPHINDRSTSSPILLKTRPPPHIIPTKPITPQKNKFTRPTHSNLNTSHRIVHTKKPTPIKWDSRVIDNEGLGRKKTACCLPMVKDGRVVSYCTHHSHHHHSDTTLITNT